MNKLVFDVGGTFIKYAVMDNDANILEKGSYPTPMIDKTTFIDSLCSIYKTYQNQVDGIAMSLPGCIDSETGFVYTPGALKYNAMSPLKDEIEAYIEKETGRTIHVAIENDGKSAALAEVWKGNLADVNDGVVMILGTGIGGGIVSDKKIYKGHTYFAGELSFLMSDTMQTGFSNALANLASASALTGKTAKYAGLPKEEVDGFKVFELLEKEDPGAKSAFDEVCQAVGGTIYNLTCILNPEKVLIGGGISKQPKLLEGIREQADKYFGEIEKFGLSMPRPQIDVCAHFNDSNMIGALYNYNQLYS